MAELKLLYPKLDIDQEKLNCEAWCCQKNERFSRARFVNWVKKSHANYRENQTGYYGWASDAADKKSYDLSEPERQKLLGGLKSIKDVIKDL